MLTAVHTFGGLCTHVRNAGHFRESYRWQVSLSCREHGGFAYGSPYRISLHLASYELSSPHSPDDTARTGSAPLDESPPRVLASSGVCSPHVSSLAALAGKAPGVGGGIGASWAHSDARHTHDTRRAVAQNWFKGTDDCEHVAEDDSAVSAR
jgi:hypothetical protein